MEKKKRSEKMVAGIIISAVLLGAAAVFFMVSFGFGKKTLKVGKDFEISEISEFYYTVSKMIDPPVFDRYVVRNEDGGRVLYHEYREGDNVTDRRKDPTFSEEIPLSAEDWEAFSEFVRDGRISVPKETAESGNGGPFLYLYRKGQTDDIREFTFREEGMAPQFRDFCEKLFNAGK